MPSLRNSIVISMYVLLPSVLMAENGEDAVTNAVGQSLWGLLKQGGWAMWPLGLCCLFVIYLAIYCWRGTVRKEFIPDMILPQVSDYLTIRRLEDSVALLKTQDSVLSRVLVAGLSKCRPDVPDANKDKVETLIGESLEAEENQIGQWVNYLNVVAAVAPMIGLLGTVSGMIGAFQTISMGGMGRPELLAGDIGEALITTATGLVIGIPAMILYFVMRNRLGTMMIATVRVASDLVDCLVLGDVGGEDVLPAGSTEGGAQESVG